MTTIAEEKFDEMMKRIVELGEDAPLKEPQIVAILDDLKQIDDLEVHLQQVGREINQGLVQFLGCQTKDDMKHAAAVTVRVLFSMGVAAGYMIGHEQATEMIDEGSAAIDKLIAPPPKDEPGTGNYL